MSVRFITMKQLREEHEEWFRPSEIVITKKQLSSTKRELLERIRALEAENAELAKENSNQKRVIQMLEYRVLELKGKPIPMEPRLPTCDALYHPRPTLQSNRSNAKEAEK